MAESSINESVEPVKEAAKTGLKFAVNKTVSFITSAVVNTIAPGIGEVGKFLIEKVALPLTKKLVTAPFSLMKNLSSSLTKSMAGGTGEGKKESNWLLYAIIIIPIAIPLLTLLNIIFTVVSFVDNTTAVFKSSSEFIDLTVTADPGVFNNLSLSETADIKYTIVIGAKSRKLTKVRIISDKYIIYPNTGQSREIKPTRSLPSPITDIPPGSSSPPLVYQAKITNTEITDSILINTIIVEATPEGLTIPMTKTVSASATVIFGTANKCFFFSDERGKWNQTDKDLVLGAIVRIMNQTNYTNKLCNNQSSIKLLRDYSPGYCEAPRNTSNIIMRQICLNTEANTFYSLVHETGHHFARRNDDIYTEFKNLITPPGLPQTESFLCSYPETKSIGEDFAETIAVYLTTRDFPQRPYDKCPGDTINLDETHYPIHYGFVKLGYFD